MMYISMIVRLTNITRTTVYHNEPIFFKDKRIDQRIKGTLGITG